MTQYVVYILKCRNGKYYTGITNDIDRRIWEHKNKINPNSYTSRYAPCKLVFYEAFHTPSDAIEFEKQVKGWRREKKEALIKRDWDSLPELSIAYKDLNKGGGG